MSRAARTLGIIAGLVLISGLLGTGAAVADEPNPMAGAPAVGTCYRLTYEQASGEHAAAGAPVSCSARHTLVVTAVGQAPDSVDWSTVDWAKIPKALGRAVYQTCASATDKLLGKPTRRAMTLYDWFWFGPTDAEAAAGARWFSCTVGLTDSTGLIPIPAGQPAKLTKRIPDSVASCAKTAKSGYASVACSRAHQWRTTYTKIVHRKPTAKNNRAAARRTCPRHMADPGWLYSRYVLSQKSFVLTCLDKTRR